MDAKCKINTLETKSGMLITYMDLVLGNRNIFFLIWYELVMLVCRCIPGALGLLLRKLLYPLLLGSVGKGVVFGRNVVFRHPHKIHIGAGTILDDNTVLDAKGVSNTGITIGEQCYIGRNTIIYTKNGDITIGNECNIGHNSLIFSSSKVVLQDQVLIAAYCYIMSGGSYDYQAIEPFVRQSSFAKGTTTISNNVWLGTKAVIADGVCIGTNSVIGAGSVVLKDIASESIAAGIPAKVKKKIEKEKNIIT